MGEMWRDVRGYEGVYEVSNTGHVRSVERVVIRRNGSPMSVRARVLKTYRTPPMMYPAVKLQCGGRDTREALRVHVLVLEAFVSPRPDGAVACHNDGDVENNRVENLRWDTQQQNLRDMVRHGNAWWTNKTHCPQGHEYTVENTYIIPSTGGRMCRTCAKNKHEGSTRRPPRPKNPHCKNGHDKEGRPKCRVCDRDAHRRRHAAQRAGVDTQSS